MLADSIYPRQGVDGGNRSQVRGLGPRQAQTVTRFLLPPPLGTVSERLTRHGGVAVCADGTLRVAKNGVLTALTLTGELLWIYQLAEAEAEADQEPLEYHSAPVTLASGSTLVTLQRTFVIVDAEGEKKHQIKNGDGFDDSGLAPNLTRRGQLIATSINGRVAVATRRRWKTVGHFGYDILPPAVYNDGSLAIAGYAWTGFCRVKLDGTFVWQTDFREADLLPCINRQQIAAVGALNENRSLFFAPDGQEVGSYDRAAVFAEHLDGTWIAYSGGVVARLTGTGQRIWEQAAGLEHVAYIWSNYQPIVDRAGCVYLVGADGIMGLDPDGAALFTVPTDGVQVIGLSLVAEQTLACIVNDELWLVHS